MVPAISASVIASRFADPALADLAAATYRAFRARRSLLLLDLQKQVHLAELPWVRAVEPYASAPADEARSVLRRVGALALDHFPGTILPNPLVQELTQLTDIAGLTTPLVEELAADIFMGRFSDKFRRAAVLAAGVVAGTLYARYYAIDPDQIRSLVRTPAPAGHRGRPRPLAAGPTFGDLCSARAAAGPQPRWSVAGNGTVIEQAQILTTHNLATLVEAGVRPTRPWVDLARAAMDRTALLLRRAVGQERPLASIKDAAYAWRQAVFFLSLADPADARAVIADPTVVDAGPAVMADLVAGLLAAADGRAGETAAGRVPFLGWTTGGHWVLDALRPPAGPTR